MDKVKDRLVKDQKAEEILKNNNLSDDFKLFKIFNLYKEELKPSFVELYYAILGWKDAHVKELLDEWTTEYEAEHN